MFCSKCLKVATVLVLPIFFNFSATAEMASRPTADKLLQIIPAKSLFCARVNHLDYTLSQVDQFLAGVSPGPMMSSTLVRTQFAKILGSPELKGVNMNGSFAIFGTATSGKPPGSKPSDFFIAILVPVTDYKQFVDGNPNVSLPDANGISKITGKTAPTMLVKQTANYALISSTNNYDRLVRYNKLMGIETSASAQAPLASALDAAEVEQAMKEPIWAYGNVQLASKTFAPLLLSKIEETKKMMKSMKAKGQGPMGDLAAIMDMYTGVLETLMKETKSLNVTIVPKPSVFNITCTISAVPGTEMADMFTANKPAKQNKLLNYLKDGAMMNFAFRMNTPFWKKYNDKCIDLLAALAGEGVSAEDIAKMKILAADMVDCLGGPMVGSSLVDAKHRPPLVYKYVISVKDEKKFNRVIDEAIEMMNTGLMAEFFSRFEMETSVTIEHRVGLYKGVSIDSAKFIIKSTEPNSPQGKMINAIYGEGFSYRWALVNGLCVAVMGGDADSAIRELIDEVKAGGPKQLASEMKSALALIPEADKADFVGTYNFLRLFGMVGVFMPMPMPQIDIPTKSNVVFAGKIGQGKMTFEIALPKQHLTEMMGMFQKMQQQQKTTKSSKGRGIESIKRGEEQFWVKCKNSGCGDIYRIDKRDYYEQIEEKMRANPMALQVPPLVCKRCGKESIYRAVKCEKCGETFFYGKVPNDFADRCSKCGYSKTEAKRKARLAKRGRYER